MTNHTVVALEKPEFGRDLLTELLRDGAHRLIEQAVQAELEEWLGSYSGRRLADGRVGVVRNGYHPERRIVTGIGPVTVRIPKVAQPDGRAGGVSFGPGSSVCAAEPVPGCGDPLVVSEGRCGG